MAGPFKKLGLIVNPRAGLGGRVGLKGSDGEEIQALALRLGAHPQAAMRASAALELLRPLENSLEILAFPGEMGADAARAAGFRVTQTGHIEKGMTRAEDTIRAAIEMERRGVDLLLFTGGDGTARNIHDALKTKMPVLGIPAGVKMHSAVYAVNPARAGMLAADFLGGRVRTVRQAEVMDLDEEAIRSDRLRVRLYGYLMVPFEKGLLQSLKMPTPPGEDALQASIARRIAGMMDDRHHYIVGPGTTTAAIMKAVNLTGTLIGVDVVYQGKLIAKDVNEQALLGLIAGRKSKIIITLIGGQGFLFGRGNQQISPEVIKNVGPDHILVATTPSKLESLKGRPLLVDTGDSAVDRLLAGYIKIITGGRDSVVYRVES